MPAVEPVVNVKAPDPAVKVSDEVAAMPTDEPAVSDKALEAPVAMETVEALENVMAEPEVMAIVVVDEMAVAPVVV